MLSKVKFKIANITFQFSSSYVKPIEWFKGRYKMYLSNGKPDLDISLEFKKERRSKIPNPQRVTFKGKKFFLRTGFFDARGDFSSGKIKVLSNYSLGLADLTRTLFSIIIVKRGGLLLHASAVADGNRSFVFCGPSESGKTTIARLLQKRDILTDETTAVVKRGNRYYAYATPFFGELGKVTKNRGAPIKAIFFLHKDTRFFHKGINKIEAMRYFLYNVILRGRNLDLAEEVLDNITDLTQSAPCYDLYFRPDKGLWRYINDIA